MKSLVGWMFVCIIVLGTTALCLAGPLKARRDAKVEAAATAAVEKAASPSKVEGLFARGRFTNVLIRAAGRQLQAGKITQTDYDKIVSAADDPDLMRALENKIARRAVSQGIQGTNDDGQQVRATTEAQVKRDWSGFLAFIQQLLPIILAFISAFGGL